MLIEYFRVGKRTRKYVDGKIYLGKRTKIKGVMVSFVSFADDENGIVQIGWSLCNKKDKFNVQRGIKIAKERAEKWHIIKNISPPVFSSFRIHRVRSAEIPQSMYKDLYKFIGRTINYYKNIKISPWALDFYSRILSSSSSVDAL